uniref:PQQ-binding-like beta-propeller repeat protein n=1 Tax=Roseihalotalea indica TaxID=2867963 RepID=A0AA49GM96_9BACT|nr:PQQ-binding-like beta-propeller repeat protein [Tunicatimonas sp. TK19036]
MNLNRSEKLSSNTRALVWKTALLLVAGGVIGWLLISGFGRKYLYGNDRSSVTKQHKTWQDYGGGADQSKYVVLDEIDKSNVDQLEVAWFYPTGDDRVYQFNPLVVDSVMYVLAKNNSLVALNARTGEEIWIHANLPGMARRGINYWESEDRQDRRLIFQINNYLQAIDAQTGKSILSFGENGLVDLREGLGRDPKTITRAQSGTPGKIFENLLLLGGGTGESYMSTPGYLRAYNVVTGERVWTFHTIPLPGEFGYDTWPKDAHKYIGGVNTWGEISVDVERGIAYYPLGSPTYDYYGGDRIGSNLFGNCILALDARTGKRIWHYQTVHHDLWDYDLSAAPQLLTVDHEGKEVDVVAVATKNGFLYVFNRETGEPLWPIEERPVPPSEVPGEEAWPTQPYPTVLPPISRQGMTSEDITPFFLTPEERAEWKAKIDSMQTGFFIPLSDKKATVSLPGAVGGVSWGNTASNPEKGMFYALSIDYPSFYGKLGRRDAPRPGEPTKEEQIAGGQNIYAQNCQVCHGEDRAGAIGPSLLNLRSQFNYDQFQQLVAAGRGEMPAFSHINEDQMKNLYSFLEGNSRGMFFGMGDDENATPDGPVVASGGVPGGLERREVVGPASMGFRMGPEEFGDPYPEDAEAPSVRYYIPPGWGLQYPYVIGPPWSSIVAYDLNEGTVKWRKPIGQDLEAAKEGGKNTGVPRAQRNGMVVTSTGLVFSTAKDGKIYAFDADNGEVLWTGELPRATEGIPAMYEVGGRNYLVVCATSSFRWGRGEEEAPSDEPTPQGGYVVYALPE